MRPIAALRVLAFSVIFIALLATGAGAATASPVAGDTFEPNDTTGTASPITSDGTIYTQYCDNSPGADYLSFPVRPGRLYEVTVSTQGYGCWGTVAVLDASGTRLTQDSGNYTFWGSVPWQQSATYWVSGEDDARFVVAFTGMQADFWSSPLIPYTVQVKEHDHPVIRGTVRDRKTGEPVGGVTVRGWGDPQIYEGGDYPYSYSSCQTTVTASDGTYALEIGQPGSIWIRFENSGRWIGEWYDSTPVTTAWAGASGQLVLKRIAAAEDSSVAGVDGEVCLPGAVDIRCVWDDTGEPAEGVGLLLITSANTVWPSWLVMPPSDAEGLTHLGGLDPRRGYDTGLGANGFQMVRDFAPSFTPVEGETTTMTIAFRRTPSTLSLSGPRDALAPGATARLTGSLSWSENPVSSASVGLERSSDGKVWSSVSTTTTGSDGNFEFSVEASASTKYRARCASSHSIGAGESSVFTLRIIQSTRLSVDMAAPSVPSFGQKVVVTGRLSSNGLLLPYESLAVLASVEGAPYAQVDTVATTGDGDFSFTAAPRSATRYVVRFSGRDAFAASQSTTLNIKPCARLTKPISATRVPARSTRTVSGYLEPRHILGRAVVTLRCYKLERGQYRFKLAVPTGDSHAGSRSKYTAAVKLPSRGRWMLKAYHADSGHAATLSSPAYVTAY